MGSLTVARNTESFVFLLSWPGSRADLELIDPDGNRVGDGYDGAEFTRDASDLSVVIRDPDAGEWSVAVRGVDVPEGEMPFYLGATARARVSGRDDDDSLLPWIIVGFVIVVAGAALIGTVVARSRT
jgi:hypothetical protein